MIPKPKHKRRVPKQGQRGIITKDQYQEALDWFGDTCNYCNGYPVEMHHVVYRSQGGRGVYRNLMPLCKQHHQMAHNSREFSESLKEERTEVFGKHFYMDAHDLCYHDLIDEPSQDQYENYMRKQEKK